MAKQGAGDGGREAAAQSPRRRCGRAADLGAGQGRRDAGASAATREGCRQGPSVRVPGRELYSTCHPPPLPRHGPPPGSPAGRQDARSAFGGVGGAGPGGIARWRLCSACSWQAFCAFFRPNEPERIDVLIRALEVLENRGEKRDFGEDEARQLVLRDSPRTADPTRRPCQLTAARRGWPRSLCPRTPRLPSSLRCPKHLGRC
jgi:hypothetical protein